MWLSSQDFLVMAVLIMAGFVRGALGFGDALVAMPLLLMMLPPRYASPLMAMTGLMIAIALLFREWRDIELRPAAFLICFGMIGIPIGVWLVTVVDERIIKTGLGTLVIAFASWSLWKPNQFTLSSNRLSPLFGLVAGVLGGAYNTAGPPLVIYGTLRQWSPLKFRAMMQAYCLFGSGWIILIHSRVGNVTLHTLQLLGTAAPFILLATFLGKRLTRGVATERFIRWAYAMLILVGLWLLVSCLPAVGSKTVEV